MIRRILRGVRHGEKGFTMIELLIVIAILGILAAVVVPNLAGFIGAGNVAAANQEVATVETAAMAYYAENQPNWPTSSDVLATEGYINTNTTYYVYTFDSWGRVDLANGTGSYVGNLTWDDGKHAWQKAS